MKEKIPKIIILNVLIAVFAIIFYSPGLMCLRPSDGLFRAGLSIILSLLLVLIFIFGNKMLIEEPEREWISAGTTIDTKQAESILKSYYNGYFGTLAKTACAQLERLGKISAKTDKVISDRFEKGSISWDRYITVIKAAEEVSLKNIVHMASRMQIFDEDEYESLRHYKEDDIPDDIQEEQIELYNRNIKMINNTISANEKILLKMDSLAMELLEGNTDDGQEILNTIKRLTEEAKYYN